MAWVPSGSSASSLTLGREAGTPHAAPTTRILTLQQAQSSGQVHLWPVGKSGRWGNRFSHQMFSYNVSLRRCRSMIRF